MPPHRERRISYECCECLRSCRRSDRESKYPTGPMRIEWKRPRLPDIEFDLRWSIRRELRSGGHRVKSHAEFSAPERISGMHCRRGERSPISGGFQRRVRRPACARQRSDKWDRWITVFGHCSEPVIEKSLIFNKKGWPLGHPLTFSSRVLTLTSLCQ